MTEHDSRTCPADLGLEWTRNDLVMDPGKIQAQIIQGAFIIS